MSKKEAIKRINANVEHIKKFGVGKIALFGSFARGEQHANSDIDILVEFEHGKKSFDNYMELKFFLEEVFGRDVDLVIKEAVKPALRHSIIDGAVYAA